MELIDKSLIIREIERQALNWYFGSSAEAKYKVEAYKEMLDALNTIEVEDDSRLETLLERLPESIADEKTCQVYKQCIYHYDGQWHVDYVGEIEYDSLNNPGSGESLREAIEETLKWLKKEYKGV